MNVTHCIARLVSNPTIARMGLLGLAVALSIVWGDHTITGVVWGA
jgi:hypothetical protein